MAVKNYAIPLDSKSKQSGDANFEDFKSQWADVTFRLSHVASGATNEINLISSKNGKTRDHKFTATISSGNAEATLTHANIVTLCDDAKDGDWDYIQAQWTVGTVDSGGTSEDYQLQGGSTYNSNGWPPA